MRVQAGREVGGVRWWVTMGVAVGLAMALVIGMGSADPAHAESASGQADARANETGVDSAPTAEELARRLELLTLEVARLRMGLPGTSGAATADPDGNGQANPADAPAVSPGRHGLAPSASKVYRRGLGVSLGGYGEAVYENFRDTREDDEPSGGVDRFDFLRQILYVGYKYNDRFLLNTEIEVEHASTGIEGEVSVEFAYIDWLLDPAFSVRGGMVLVPVGLVNEIHEPTTFLGAKRAAVEQAIIPTTWRENGIGVHGEVGPLAYRSYVMTGLDASSFTARGIRGGRQKGSEAKAESFAWVGRLEHTSTPGLNVGGSVYYGTAGQDLAPAAVATARDEAMAGGEAPAVVAGGEAPAAVAASALAAATVAGNEAPEPERLSVPVRLVEAHAEWRSRGIETRALGVVSWIGNTDELNPALGLSGSSAVGSRQWGGYLQVGYDVLTRAASSVAVVPFLRYERLDTQDQVEEGFASAPANDQTIWTFGVVARPIDQVVLKTDYQVVTNRAETGVDQFNVALGYIF